jgi:hypothetical protein
VEVWPTIKSALAGTTAPNAGAQNVYSAIDSWITNSDASRLDAQANAADGTVGKGKFDFPGVSAWDQARGRIVNAVLGGRLDSDTLSALWGVSDGGNRSYTGAGPGYVSKDLRKLLGKPVLGSYKGFTTGNGVYCGAGVKSACQTAIWNALSDAAPALESQFSSATPSAWLGNAAAERIEFPPLKPNGLTMRWTNRPTFQQIISFSKHR